MFCLSLLQIFRFRSAKGSTVAILGHSDGTDAADSRSPGEQGHDGMVVQGTAIDSLPDHPSPCKSCLQASNAMAEHHTSVSVVLDIKPLEKQKKRGRWSFFSSASFNNLQPRSALQLCSWVPGPAA